LKPIKNIPKEKKVPLVLVVPNFPPCEPIDGIEIIRVKKSPDEIAALMRKAIAFVFPSFHESFGMPLIEAMACGCPIITSNITACPENR
jgi:glycosyltransferase involved in cell wall biosynthesis